MKHKLERGLASTNKCVQFSLVVCPQRILQAGEFLEVSEAQTRQEMSVLTATGGPWVSVLTATVGPWVSVLTAAGGN